MSKYGIGNNSSSSLDKLYRALLGGGVFPAGWGDPYRIKALMEFHKIMSNRIKVQSLVEREPIISIEKSTTYKECISFRGEFFSPFAKHFPGLLPKASEMCKFELIVPKSWKSEDKPIALHMAGTGDQYYWRRRNFLAWPLAVENGIGSLIIENPFYGARRPPEQIRSNVRFVSDIFVMGGGLMLESLTLLNWLSKNDYGPFCMTGISMGGHMASLCATNYDRPIGIAPCLSWTTASPVFTRGVMTNAINWKACDYQFLEKDQFRAEIWDKLIHYDLLMPDKRMPKIRDKKVKLSEPKQAESRPVVKGKFFKLLEDFRLKKLLESLNGLSFLPNFSIINLVNGGNNSKKMDSKQSDFKLVNLYTLEDNVLRRDTLEFMRRLMDHFTHLSNFEKPIDPELAVFVSARNDAYVLRDGVKDMKDIWPGCTVEYVNAGHVTAYVIYQRKFREAICESIEKHRMKYNKDGIILKSYSLAEVPISKKQVVIKRDKTRGPNVPNSPSNPLNPNYDYRLLDETRPLISKIQKNPNDSNNDSTQFR